MATSLSSLPAIFSLSHGVKSFPSYNQVTKQNLVHHYLHNERTIGKLIVTSVTKDSKKSEENRPSWSNPESNEPPPWAKNEARGSKSEEQSFEIPFYVYLLASAITAIAAIGSVFEYVSKNPVFGVLNSDSIFYTPVLGFFAFTGIPTSVFLWFKSVEAANKEAEELIQTDSHEEISHQA